MISSWSSVFPWLNLWLCRIISQHAPLSPCLEISHDIALCPWLLASVGSGWDHISVCVIPTIIRLRVSSNNVFLCLCFWLDSLSLLACGTACVPIFAGVFFLEFSFCLFLIYTYAGLTNLIKDFQRKIIMRKIHYSVGFPYNFPSLERCLQGTHESFSLHIVLLVFV